MCDVHFATLAVLVVFISSRCGQAQVAMYDVRVDNLLKMQQGVGWPTHINMVKGQEALMRLSTTLANTRDCKVVTPAGLEFDARNPPSARYEFWSNGCGIRIKNVGASDHGRWRLVVTRGAESITGWTELSIADDPPSQTPSDRIALQDGTEHAEFNLTSLESSYCLVTQPFSESSLVSGHCRVTLDRTTRAVQGRWNVVLGVPGRVAELQMERNIAVETEQLVSGYKEDANKLHLYCNIVHTAKNITFCRFQRNAEVAGYNIMDGLSDGIHSYYGDGFATRQCGMTIETPSPADYGTWRCTVGMRERSGTVLRTSAPMQALIRVAPREQSHSDYTRTSETMAEETRTLLVEKDSNLVMMCRAEVSLAYCWFQHPNGTQFTPIERQAGDERHFWYTGESLQTGDCGMTFAKVTDSEAGEWTCHMGPKDQLGVEVTDKINVRVTGILAANKKEVDVRVGGAATLYCQTANGPKPLDYCRFLTPTYVGISVGSSVTSENAILDRFYFTPERNLDYGDCSLTIDPVTDEDIGEWTCAGLVHDHTEEVRDSIAVVYAAHEGVRKAGIAAMSIGIIGVVFLATLLAAVVWHRKGRPVPWTRASFSDTTSNAFSFGTRTNSPTSRNSNGSGSVNGSEGSNENVIDTQSRVTDVNETANEMITLEMRNISHRDSDSSNEIPIRIRN